MLGLMASVFKLALVICGNGNALKSGKMNGKAKHYKIDTLLTE
ncbi:MAG: hypothetical protein WCS87_19910 [Methylococcaceae bacterium]